MSGIAGSEPGGLESIERRSNLMELPEVVFNRDKTHWLNLGELKKGLSYDECRSKVDRAEMKLKENPELKSLVLL